MKKRICLSEASPTSSLDQLVSAMTKMGVESFGFTLSYEFGTLLAAEAQASPSQEHPTFAFSDRHVQGVIALDSAVCKEKTPDTSSLQHRELRNKLNEYFSLIGENVAENGDLLALQLGEWIEEKNFQHLLPEERKKVLLSSMQFALNNYRGVRNSTLPESIVLALGETTALDTIDEELLVISKQFIKETYKQKRTRNSLSVGEMHKHLDFIASLAGAMDGVALRFEGTHRDEACELVLQAMNDGSRMISKAIREGIPLKDQKMFIESIDGLANKHEEIIGRIPNKAMASFYERRARLLDKLYNSTQDSSHLQRALDSCDTSYLALCDLTKQQNMQSDMNKNRRLARDIALKNVRECGLNLRSLSDLLRVGDAFNPSMEDLSLPREECEEMFSHQCELGYRYFAQKKLSDSSSEERAAAQKFMDCEDVLFTFFMSQQKDEVQRREWIVQAQERVAVYESMGCSSSYGKERATYLSLREARDFLVETVLHQFLVGGAVGNGTPLSRDAISQAIPPSYGSFVPVVLRILKQKNVITEAKQGMVLSSSLMGSVNAYLRHELPLSPDLASGLASLDYFVDSEGGRIAHD